LAIFFGKKKDEEPGAAALSAKADAGGSSPEKARKFFDHARTVQETAQYEYAMKLWLDGLRHDASSMDGLQSFFGCTAQFLAEGKKGPGKDLMASVSGKTDVDKYLRSLLEWGLRPTEAARAVDAFKAATDLKLKDPAVWIGERAFGFTMKEKKVRKDLLLKIADLYAKLELPERAVNAAEAALKLDPSDGELAAYVRNLAASATMNRGGYDKAGQEGGFRQNVRDVEKQRQLEDSDKIVKTEDAMDRLIAVAEEQVRSRPGDLPSMEQLARRLLERGRGPDEHRAHDILMSAFQTSGAFRFREMAGDVRIRQSARKVRELQQMLEKSPGSEMIQNMLRQQQEDHLRLELEEFKERVAAYPTDLGKKFELGRRFFQLGNNDEAIALFQHSQQDAKLRVNSQALLGQAFHRIGYYDEAIQTFKAALTGDMAPDFQLDLQYNLMLSLLEHAKHTKNTEALREADRLASSIAMKQFNYREIRARRDEIKSLLAAGGPG